MGSIFDVGNDIQQVGNAVGNAGQSVGNAVGNASNYVSQTYASGDLGHDISNAVTGAAGALNLTGQAYNWIKNTLSPQGPNLQSPTSIAAPNANQIFANQQEQALQNEAQQAKASGTFYGNLGAADSGLNAPSSTSSILLGN